MSQPISALVTAFALQAQWCEQMGSPFNAALLRDLAANIAAGGRTAEIIGPWREDATDSALPLRLTGALHAIVLGQEDPALAEVYPPAARAYDSATWPVVRGALGRHRPFIAAFLHSAPQTNEVRRSAILLGGFLAAAARFGLPLRLREIGASAGLNLAWPAYAYDMGRWRWGRPDSGLTMSSEWRGTPPPLAAPVAIFDRRGCDLHPIRLDDPAHRRRLEAYVWPDQRDRLDRLRRAMTVAARLAIHVEQAPADAWLARELASPPRGACTVLFHSITWQYIAAAERERIARTIAAAGDAAEADRPFCHLRFEPEDGGFLLRLRSWPDGSEHALAKADAHGRWIEWIGEREAADGQM